MLSGLGDSERPPIRRKPEGRLGDDLAPAFFVEPALLLVILGLRGLPHIEAGAHLGAVIELPAVDANTHS